MNVTKIPTSTKKAQFVLDIPSHHSGAEGWDFAGRKHSGGSGAIAAGGPGASLTASGRCSESWLRTGFRLSCPWGAVGDCWIMLARLLGCATAGGSWLWCACHGGPLEATPGRPPGLRVLRGPAGFALRVGVPDSGNSGLPPRRCACTVPVSCGAANSLVRSSWPGR